MEMQKNNVLFQVMIVMASCVANILEKQANILVSFVSVIRKIKPKHQENQCICKKLDNFIQNTGQGTTWSVIINHYKNDKIDDVTISLNPNKQTAVRDATINMNPFKKFEVGSATYRVNPNFQNRLGKVTINDNPVTFSKAIASDKEGEDGLNTTENESEAQQLKIKKLKRKRSSYTKKNKFVLREPLDDQAFSYKRSELDD